MSNLWSRVKKSQKVIPPVIEEEDFLELSKLLEGNNETLLEFVESFCFFRMFIFGFIKKDLSCEEKLVGIIDGLNKSGNDQEITLPAPFETARKILLKVRKKEDFERVLKEVRLASAQLAN